MPSWRDELIEAVKTKDERDAEEQARHKKRVEEALTTAAEALRLAAEGMSFTCDRLKEKGQPAELTEGTDQVKLHLFEVSLSLELSRETAVIKVTFGDSKPREFDFAKDRHISPADVEEYIGRRSLEFVRAAHKAHPW